MNHNEKTYAVIKNLNNNQLLDTQKTEKIIWI